MQACFISSPPFGKSVLFGCAVLLGKSLLFHCVVRCICILSLQTELFVVPELLYVGAIPELYSIGYKKEFFTPENSALILSILIYYDKFYSE